MGKSPAVEIFKNGSTTPIVLAETGHIISYIIKHYDTGKILAPLGPEEEEKADYYYYFAEGSFQNYLVSLLIGSFAKKQAPWGAGFLVSKVVDAINGQYYKPELIKSLTFLDTQLANKSNPNYFVGDHLTGADIILSFPIYINIFDNLERVKTTIGNFDPVKKFPHLYAWSQQVAKQPNFIKANKIEDAELAKLKNKSNL